MSPGFFLFSSLSGTIALVKKQKPKKKKKENIACSFKDSNQVRLTCPDGHTYLATYTSAAKEYGCPKCRPYR